MNATSRRVVVTGLGIVSPLGVGLRDNLDALRESRTGIRQITSFDASRFPTRVAGEVPAFDVRSFATGSESLRGVESSPKSQYAYAAAAMALDQSGRGSRDLSSERAGICLGVGLNFPRELADSLADCDEAEFLRRKREAFAGSSPETLLDEIVPREWAVDMPERVLARAFGVRGPVAAFSSACSASAHGIGSAFHAIRSGRADTYLAGGCDAMITSLGIAGFCLLEVTTRRNDDPATACRPFDRTRDGTVISEGAVVLTLEEFESAKRRGAEPLAEIVGFGASCDGYRLTDTPPDGNGIARSMQAALADARLVPEEIDYINAHGTATPQNDVSETRAIKAVFGAHAAKLPVSSTKSMTGHMVAAAGAMEAAICVLGLRNGLVFATATLRESDPQCDLDHVPGACRERALRIALSNSCGLGGQNGTLIFRAWR